MTKNVVLFSTCQSLIGHDNKQPKGSNRGVQKILPIEIPAMSLADLNRMTNNFGQKALIGEGSYGRVFYGVLSSGQPAAIKKLDPSASQEPDPDFVAQVCFSLLPPLLYNADKAYICA